MKFKVDENLPIELADLLNEAGHNAVTVHDEKLGGQMMTTFQAGRSAELSRNGAGQRRGVRARRGGVAGFAVRFEPRPDDRARRRQPTPNRSPHAAATLTRDAPRPAGHLGAVGRRGSRAGSSRTRGMKAKPRQRPALTR
ncbi:MAG: DUF5615 family PIN-like protein [Vicinamibacteria bacterium]